MVDEMKKKLLSILLACILALGAFGVFGVTTPVLATNTETLRPDAAGDETSIDKETPTDGIHWTLVDEITPDGNSTRVYTNSLTYERDLYDLPAHSGSGTINFIKVYFRCQKDVAHIYTAYAKPSLKSNATVTDGTQITVTASWVTYSQQWNTNPAPPGTDAWTWDDIDALQIGVSLMHEEYGGYPLACTQVYVEVDYTTAPAVTTNAATYVAQTSARLNSTVDADGGEPCDIRFGYGTITRTPAQFETYNDDGGAEGDGVTDWVENTYTTGQHPFVDIADLTANTEYFFRVQIRNNHSTVTGGELTFTTELGFDPSTNLKAYPGSTTVGLTWTKGTGATNTMIRYSEVTYPTDETEGTLSYLGPLASHTITGLTIGHTYYIVAIGTDNGNYSATLEVMATTTAGAAVGEEPTDPTMPTGWFQSPDHTGLSGLPLYDQMNDLFDAYEIPPESGWFFSAILVCVILGAVVFVISRHPTPAVITLAVSLAIASLIKLLPLYMMAFSVVFIIGVWQLGRES